jgi:hypothetical protein
LAQVYLPALLQPCAGGRAVVDVAGVTLRQVIDKLAAVYPELRLKILDEDGNLRSHLAIAVDGEIAATGLREQLVGNPEIHFVMAIKGGRFGFSAK